MPGADYGERPERESKWGSGGGVPNRIQEQSQCGDRGLRHPVKLKVGPFLYKKWQNVKDLSENLPRGLRQTASRSNDQP